MGATSLEMLDPASPRFVDDALEFQLLRGPHACARGEIPTGITLARMAWGLIRAFEVWDEYESLEAAGIECACDDDAECECGFGYSDSEDEAMYDDEAECSKPYPASSPSVSYGYPMYPGVAPYGSYAPDYGYSSSDTGTASTLSTPSRTPSPCYSDSSSLSASTSPAEYSQCPPYHYDVLLDEAEHPWPAIVGTGEPVRSRWLLSFGNTAHLLQTKAFNLACA